jgi:hypothetical protein
VAALCIVQAAAVWLATRTTIRPPAFHLRAAAAS